MESDILFNLSISLILGLLSSKLMKMIKMPNVTGYLIIGLLAGPYCLNILSIDVIEKFSIIPDVALGFIAFSIGAEFKLSYLKKVGKAPLVIAFTEAIGAVLLVDLVLIIAGYEISFVLVLGAIAAATAPAATLMVVRQYKAKGPVTNTLLPVVAIDDAAALILFGISVAISKAITSTGTTSIASTLLDPIIEIVGALVFGAVLGVALAFATKWFTGRGNRLVVSTAMILLCISVCNALGYSPLLACMAMSAVYVNLSKVSNKVFDLIDRFTPPIFMLFFFISGAELNLTILPAVGIIGILYIVFRVVGKISGAAIGATISKSEPEVKKYLGYTLIPQAGVAIGLASVAMSVVPEYGQKIRTIVLCGTVIYELVGPLVTKLALKKAGEINA
ncbi:MAG: cation:proton antiporter [Clostridiaceae bacterium]|jgi:Kef-type K+ transport system membrane component KefB|nr:cation:proton antiporter [Herbinix sp.]NLP00557.1 cation:proton antiporter [Clostridiaceae bacterium]